MTTAEATRRRYLLLISRQPAAFEKLNAVEQAQHLSRCGTWCARLGIVTQVAVAGLAGIASSHRTLRRVEGNTIDTPRDSAERLTTAAFIDARDDAEAQALALTHPDLLFGSVDVVPLLWATEPAQLVAKALREPRDDG